MKVIIPMAGKGERLLPHTIRRQKVLLPVAGKPVLDYVLAPFIDAGLDDFRFVVGHLGDQIQEHMSKYENIHIEFISQFQQEGLGHAIYQALDNSDEPVLIVLADNIFELDLDEFFEAGNNVIGVVEVDDPSSFGIVELEGRRVVDMVEKPQEPVSNLAIAGLYRIDNQGRLRRAIHDLMEIKQRTRGEYQLTDALESMLQKGTNFRVFELDGWHDCGTEKSLLSTNRHFLAASENQFIHETAQVDGSTIRFSTIMNDCVLINTIVDNSIILPGAKLEKCYVHDEIIRAGVELTEYRSGKQGD